MKRFIAALALLAGSSLPALAADYSVGPIGIDAPFARSSPKIANAGAGFMVLRNGGAQADRLLAATADVSRTVELHTVVRDGDMMTMKQVEAIDLPAGATVELKPGSFHVMFMNLHAPLQEGASFPLKLKFEKAGEVSVTMPVKGMAAMPMAAAGHMPAHGGASAAALPPGDVVVMAAGPLAKAMGEAKDRFTAATGSSVGLASGHSPDHAKQLLSGAPADLYVGADGPWVKELADGGKLVAGTVGPLLGNALVLVARQDSPLRYAAKPGEALDQELAGGKLATADPAIAPAGQYARAALTKLGVIERMEGKLALYPNLAGVVKAVESGEAAAGIVLATDVKASGTVKVVTAFPADSHPPVRTVIGLVAGRDNAKARAFYDFLRSKDGRALFAAHGFTVAE